MPPFTPPDIASLCKPNEKAFATSLAQTVADQVAKQWQFLTLELETITPVYGGGTIAGEVDLLAPFRPRAIKNLIRHWWWLTNRHRYENRSNELYRDMAALFGSATEAYPCSGTSGIFRVAVRPDPTSALRTQTYRGYASSRGLLAKAKGKTTVHPSLNYAGWPLDLDSGQERSVLLPGVKFELEISFKGTINDRNQSAVLEALSAWVLFGGIGARTSRGFGRIRCVKALGELVDRTAFEFSSDVPEKFRQFRVQASPNVSTSAESAWGEAVDAFHTFRQARGPSHRGSNHRFNRAYLPTGDSIRAITGNIGYGRHYYKTPQESNRLQPQNSAFPALMFGAPVQFKFIPITSRFAPSGMREPAEGRLNWTVPESDSARGKRVEPAPELAICHRFSSPVILSVVHLGDNKFAPATIWLSPGARGNLDLAGRAAAIEMSSGRIIRLSRDRAWPLAETDEIAVWTNLPKPRARVNPNDPLARGDSFDDELHAKLVTLGVHGNPCAVWLSFFDWWCSPRELRLDAEGEREMTRRNHAPEKDAENKLGPPMDADARRRAFAQSGGNGPGNKNGPNGRRRNGGAP